MPTPNPAKAAGKTPPPRVCSLVLTIAGTPYRVKPTLVTPTHRAFRLSKCKGSNHIVTGTATGASCSCPAFAHRKTGQRCKHVDACKAAGLI